MPKLPWVLLLACTLPARAAAQDGSTADLRQLHEQAVFATTRIESPRGELLGTGWLLRQRTTRPLIVTNRHVLPLPRGTYRIAYYAGTDRDAIAGTARVVHVASELDFALLWPEEDPPPSARPLELEAGDIVRGERVVLGGNPHDLPFQTSEGVVTGHLPEILLTRTCGLMRNCVVIDAAAFRGSSGGPVLNRSGRLVGMLWGVEPAQVLTRGGALPAWVQAGAFAYAIHVRVLEEELSRVRR